MNFKKSLNLDGEKFEKLLQILPALVVGICGLMIGIMELVAALVMIILIVIMVFLGIFSAARGNFSSPAVAFSFGFISPMLPVLVYALFKIKHKRVKENLKTS